MKCPACQSESTKVVDTRRQGEQQGKKRQRRRECTDCGNRFNTIEVAVDKKGVPLIGKMPLPFPLKVKKRSGKIKNFDRDTLMHSITAAIPPADNPLPLEEIFAEIYEKLPEDNPLPTQVIGEITAKVLATISPLSAATYLLRHRHPHSKQDLRDLLNEAHALLDSTPQ